MEEMAVSTFKATCLGVLERVRKTGQPVLVTRRGVPLAQVLPPPPPAARSAFGVMRDHIGALGNLVDPAAPDDWEALG